MTKLQKLQGLILLVGIVGSVVVFESTPSPVFVRPGESIEVLYSARMYSRIEAALRGGGFLALAASAFAGVTVMFKNSDLQ